MHRHTSSALAALAVLGLLLSACAAGMNARPAEPGVMSARQLALILDSGEVLPVDLRGEEEYQASGFIIPGAVHMTPADFILKHKGLPRDKMLVVYCSCPNDATSHDAATILVDAGYSDVFVLQGGWAEWLLGDYPLEDKD